MEQLSALQDGHDFIGDVRGKGLMLGMEIVDPDRMDEMGNPKGNGQLARKLQAACFAHGLIVELGGRDGAVMRLLPPLNVDAAQVDAISAVISRACQIVDGQIRESMPECGRTARNASCEEAELSNLSALAEACTTASKLASSVRQPSSWSLKWSNRIVLPSTFSALEKRARAPMRSGCGWPAPCCRRLRMTQRIRERALKASVNCWTARCARSSEQVKSLARTACDSAAEFG